MSPSSYSTKLDRWSLDELRRRIEEYLQNNTQVPNDRTLHAGLCVAIAGGGSSFLSALAATPGASSILMDGSLLYGRESYKDYLNVPPSDTRSESLVSTLAAQQLADAACRRALRLISTYGSRDNELRHYRAARGLACTSMLQSNKASDSNSKAYMTCQGSLSDDPSVSLHVELYGNRSRFEEDVFVGHCLLTALQVFQAAMIDQDVTNALPTGLEVVVNRAYEEIKVKSELGDEILLQIGRNKHNSTRERIESAAEKVLSRTEKVVMIRPNDDNTDFEVLHSSHVPKHSLVVPGSFNPPHRGHLALAIASSQAMGRCDIIFFEISITNPDKPSIPASEVAQRVLKFLELDGCYFKDIAKWGILLTDAPLFAQKAYILAPRYGVLTFAIGSDTLVRLIDPKYYKDSRMDMLTALNEMNCDYIVGGRLQQKQPNGTFISGLEQIGQLPDSLATRFKLLQGFRVDISSTAIRAQQQKEQLEAMSD